MSWATPAEVMTITRRQVAQDVVDSAQAIIELHVDRTEDDTPEISARDLRWLKQAVAWQAAWLPDQPGFTSRSVVTNVSQESQSTTFAHEQAVVLAPLAIVAIRKLSWRKSRTLLAQPLSREDRRRLLKPGELLPEDWDRDDEGWVPL
jgi:hypothetical protein